MVPKDINGYDLMNVKIPLANVEELPELKVIHWIEIHVRIGGEEWRYLGNSLSKI